MRALTSLLALCLLAAAVPAAAAERLPVLEAQGTELRLTVPDGRILGSAELVGAVLQMTLMGGRQSIRIDAVERDARHPDLLLHAFSILDPRTNAWQPLCKPDASGGRLGFPMQLDASGRQFTLTCLSGAEGKCIRMGYMPWRTLADGRSLAGHFRACIHLVRADYCGNEQPSTRDGTLIDVYDMVGIQQPENDDRVRFEAAWGAEGAVCVARTRIPEVRKLADLPEGCPRIRKLGPECTEAAMRDRPDVLLFNRSLPID